MPDQFSHFNEIACIGLIIAGIEVFKQGLWMHLVWDLAFERITDCKDPFVLNFAQANTYVQALQLYVTKVLPFLVANAI